MTRYGCIVSMATKTGRREEVISILLRGAGALQPLGCQSYVVSRATSDADLIWVTEIWASKAAHDDSLRLPEAKAAIAEAIPMLTMEFTNQELDVVGGLFAH
jgi:quinol monooxygenase YgiN